MTTARGQRGGWREICLTKREIVAFRGRLADLLRQHGIDPTQPYTERLQRHGEILCYRQWQPPAPSAVPEDWQDG